MALAYTPGLKIQKDSMLLKERKLPLAGEVLVNVGDKVNFDTAIAKASIPGGAEVISVAGLLGCEPKEVPSLMVKKIGDRVKKGEVIAETPGFFGKFKSRVLSPVDGIIHSVSEVTGQVIVKCDPIKIEINAYVPGKVIQVLPKYGAIIETRGAIVQGIFGIGGETHGEIKMIVDSPNEEVTEGNISSNCAGKILIGGSAISLNALKKALEVGAKGVVVGGIDSDVLDSFVGYEISIGITGHEQIGLTLMITEGFGRMNMALRTFNLLKTFEGYMAAMNGATQIRAGVIRPEVIIPRPELADKEFKEEKISFEKGMTPGMTVRIIRQPYFGRIGRIVALPPHLQKIPTESFVRIAIVELDDGTQVIVPRANLEMLEE